MAKNKENGKRKKRDRGNECRIFDPPPGNVAAGMPEFEVKVWAKGDTAVMSVQAWITAGGSSSPPVTLVHSGGDVYVGNLAAPVGTFRIEAEAEFWDPMEPPTANDDWGDYTGVP